MSTLKALQTLHSLDVATFSHIVRWNTRRSLCRLARIVSHSADGWPYLLVPLLLMLTLPSLAWPVLVALVTGFAIERLSYYVLKNSFKRRRPPKSIPGFQSVITASDEFSFPSGHTSGAFLMATVLVLLLPMGIAAYLYGWASLVALSRVVLGVHFPLDTVAGAMLGSGIGWWAVQLVTV